MKHAEGLNLLGMAQAVTDIADRARNKKLTPDEVQGGTFTITNPAATAPSTERRSSASPRRGSSARTRSSSARGSSRTLGKDVIAIRPIMNITLTYYHRLVDGALAGRFLKDLKKRSRPGTRSRTDHGTSCG